MDRTGREWGTEAAVLSEAERCAFFELGYLRLPSVFSTAEVAEVRAAFDRIELLNPYRPPKRSTDRCSYWTQRLEARFASTAWCGAVLSMRDFNGWREMPGPLAWRANCSIPRRWIT